MISINTVSSKVSLRHLERLAYIYVRQSSPKQVERNRESQLYQSSLSQRARELGWSEDRIKVIDMDLGLSGKGSDYRDGFQELVAELSLGHVGIIFGYEVSRLARNNCDWYHLLDLASVFSTLIADADGIYDPRLYNDRLLLGLKGTMSEAELHLLRMRLDAGRIQQVQRGVYGQNLPAGFVRLQDGTVVKDPDKQVEQVIALVFAKFTEFGSCRQVLRYFLQEKILLPRRHCAGRQAGELLWKPASDAALLSILHNPAYAGTFAYGRRQSEPTQRQPQRPGTGRLHKPMSQWLHLQQGVYPRYISWEEFLENQNRLKENSTLYREKANRSKGPAREGAALLQGLAVCGLCGARMSVCYKATRRYQCNNLERQVLGGACASLHGSSLDEAIVEAFFEALRPAQLDALEAVIQQQEAEHERLDRHWKDQLKRAEYEAHLAQRQYGNVDPENRLVAAELERRWEEKLHRLHSVEEDYARFQRRPLRAKLTPEQKEQFQHLSETLPGLWSSGALTITQQKELLRCLISKVILKRIAPDQVEVRIVWISGHYSRLVTRPPIHRECDVSGYEEMVNRIRSLLDEGIESDEEMAAQLTKEGFHSARSEGVIPRSVQKIRLSKGWFGSLHKSRGSLLLDGRLTVLGLAKRLGVSRNWVYRRLANGEIEARYISRHPQSQVWLIEDCGELVEELSLSVSRSDKKI